MSVHVLSWVLRNSPETLGRRLVLLVLADHAAEDGTGAWPSVETIGKEARLSPRQVRRCLRDLEESEAIIRTGVSEFGTNVYRVVVEGGQSVRGGRTSATAGEDDLSAKTSLEPSTVRERLRLSRTALDRIFDELASFAGLDVEKLNRAESGRIVAARRDIIESVEKAVALRYPDADPATWITNNVEAVCKEIERRGREYRKEWPQAERTATALAANWSRFERTSPELDAERAREERGRRLRERIAEKERA